MDATITLGPCQLSLQATIDHHGHSMYSGHYIIFVKCCEHTLLDWNTADESSVTKWRSYILHSILIGSIDLSYCYHIFPWLCAWDGCYIIPCYLLHLHSGKTGNLFSSLVCSSWREQIVVYVYVLKIVFDYLCITPAHNHHCANFTEDIELIKCLSDIFCRVCEFTHFPCGEYI